MLQSWGILPSNKSKNAVKQNLLSSHVTKLWQPPLQIEFAVPLLQRCGNFPSNKSKNAVK